MRLTRDAEPEPEPPEPAHFARSRSRSRSRSRAKRDGSGSEKGVRLQQKYGQKTMEQTSLAMFFSVVWGKVVATNFWVGDGFRFPNFPASNLISPWIPAI